MRYYPEIPSCVNKVVQGICNHEDFFFRNPIGDCQRIEKERISFR